MKDVLLMRAACADVQPDRFRIIIQMQLCRLLFTERFVASLQDNGGWIPSSGPSLRGFPVSALKAVWIISHSVSGGVSGWLFVSICQPCDHLTTCHSPYNN